MYHPQRNAMYAKDALCVAAITIVYPRIGAVEYLGGNEFVERDSENRRPDHARTVVCHLQDPPVATADVSASQQECYYYRNREDHTLLVLIIYSFSTVNISNFRLKCKSESLILKRKPPITEEINRFKPAPSLIVKRRWQK